MPVRKDRDQWRYRVVVKLEGGRKVRISGTPQINTKEKAVAAERAHIERVLHDAIVAKHAPESIVARGEAPTLSEWFRGGASGDEDYRGRFWREHAVGEKENRESTLEEKRNVFERHIEPALGAKRLNEIDRGVINQFRAELQDKTGRTGKKLSAKTRANILTVLATSLRYASEEDVIREAPYVKIKKPPAPEMDVWDFDQYARLLGAAFKAGEPWTTAVMLAGDCGLRLGEILALEYQRDIDLVAGTITVNAQMRRGVLGPPKGGKSGTVPMTPRLREHLRSLPRIRAGRVVVDDAGVPLGEGEAKHQIYRLCRLAGLPERSWHTMRHAYATHSALLGVNPFTLQARLRHSDISMTMRYVKFAAAHSWPIPEHVLTAGADILRPDHRVVVQLGERPIVLPEASWQRRGKKKEPGKILSDSTGFAVAGAGFEPVD